MVASCVKCGGPLPVQTGRGRRRTKCAACSPSRTRKPASAPASRPPVPPGAGLLAATRAELVAAGVVDSSAGQAALLLAERVEFGDNSGSAVALMVRQLHDTMTRALAAEVAQVVDPVEQFRGRLRSV